GELAPAEIPEWLDALRPQDEDVPGEEGPLEAAGVLAGLSGILPMAAVAPAVGRAEASRAAEISEASLARAQLLQGLVTRVPDAAEPRVERRKGTNGRQLARALVVLVMALVVIGGLAAAYWFRPLPTFVELPSSLPAADRLYDAVEALGPGDVVLVAAEYWPGQSDELGPVAAPVLRHLLDQGVSIQVVSTRPEGQALTAVLLQDLLGDGALAEALPYELPEWGYQPGDAVGVTRLLRLAPSARMVVVLAAQPAGLRWWVEQVTAYHDQTMPLMVIASASLEPVASTYLADGSEQIGGAVSGLAGAAYYESRLSGGQTAAPWTLNVLAAAQVAAVGLIILGAVASLFGGGRRRRS
ncbi:MAG: hypothetical protein GX601_09400, partial [Anaerolineales bacterium]|nr:hypothetical protein [Anaerolineales bacterium]